MLRWFVFLALAGCRPTGGSVVDSSLSSPPGETGDSQVEPQDSIEEVPASDGCTQDSIFSDEGVHAFGIELSEAAIAALTADPGTYVQGAFSYGERRLEPVGVRLKGNSSFQSFDGKPAWKIKIDEYVEGWEFCGLDRVTLHNNIWDTSMMAETLAYRAFREAGSAAPRTGYATVALNGEAMGLYTIVEAIDRSFAEHRWPGSQGGLWEMTRNCDFTGSCDCFDLKWAGERFDDTALARACQGVAERDVDALWRVFDREAVLAFLAMEVVVNHPDSYTYNLNNWHMYHDPLEDRISLSPWGADSTFIYYYPPSDTHACEVWSRYDNFTDSILGDVTTWCRGDAACQAELWDATLLGADVLEAMDMPGLVEHYRDLISEHVHADPRISWPAEYHDHKVDCLVEWIAARPDAVRGWLE